MNSFPDGVWAAVVKDGAVLVQYLLLGENGTQRTYMITPNEKYKAFLIEEIQMTLNGLSTLFPSLNDPGIRRALASPNSTYTNVRQNASTSAEVVYQLKKEEVIRYIPINLLPPELTHTDTLKNGETKTWLPVFIDPPGENNVIQGWIRQDAVKLQPLPDEDAPVPPTPPVLGLPPLPPVEPETPVEIPAPAPEPQEPPQIADSEALDNLLARLRQSMDSLDINIKSKSEQVSDARHEWTRLDAELQLLETSRKDMQETVTFLTGLKTA